MGTAPADNGIEDTRFFLAPPNKNPENNPMHSSRPLPDQRLTNDPQREGRV
ncbi:hypothetical protein ABIF97_006558 [Bradyrhizobium japonicum]